MASRLHGDFGRSVVSALSVIVAAVVPSLIPSTALAEKASDKATDSAQAEGKPAKAAKPKAKKHAAKAAKAAKKGDAKSDAKGDAKADEARADAKAKAPAKGKKVKKTASRSGSSRRKAAKKADSEAPGRRCTSAPISVDRGGLEGQALALLDCHGRPVAGSTEALSVLARPWGAPRPAHLAAVKGKKGKPAVKPPFTGKDEIAPGVRLLDKGLLTRVTAIAKRFPNRPISLVSGYRPQSRGSQHQVGRALDLRVAGVSNEELVAFCKTLPDTGCGYYPNSSFVHVDVRKPGTGSVTWIDTSGPGEAPHYVGQWPPPPEAADTAVLPPDTEPHDSDVDPWAVDPGDEHAAHKDDTSDTP